MSIQKSSMVLLLFWVGVSSDGPATDLSFTTPLRKPTVESGAEIEKYQIRPRGILVGNAALTASYC